LSLPLMMCSGRMADRAYCYDQMALI